MPPPLSIEKKRERSTRQSPHHNKWNFHCGPTNLKLNSLSKWGAMNSLCNHTKLSGSWRIRPPHQTDIRNQSPVILGLVGLLRRAVASCVPLAIPPNQKYNPWGAPHVTHRCHIAFNSHGENLLAAFPAFTLLCTHSLLSRFQIMSYSTTSNRFCQHFSLHLTHWF